MMLNSRFSCSDQPWGEADIPEITDFLMSGTRAPAGEAEILVARIDSLLRDALKPGSVRMVVLLRDSERSIEGVAVVEQVGQKRGGGMQSFVVTDVVACPARIPSEVEGRLLESVEDAVLTRCGFVEPCKVVDATTTALVSAPRKLFSKPGFKQLKARDYISGAGMLAKVIWRS